MDVNDRHPQSSDNGDGADEFPLQVASDWNSQVEAAERVCRLIDRHLNPGGKGWLSEMLGDFPKLHLSPKQRVRLITELYELLICDDDQTAER